MVSESFPFPPTVTPSVLGERREAPVALVSVRVNRSSLHNVRRSCVINKNNLCIWCEWF